jgi:sugar/nucleoside kinase (ribokinase family)
MDIPLVVVAGHTALDMIPTLKEGQSQLAELLAPGQLRRLGPMVLATGGAVTNTGLALHRLGTPVRLVGKVGDDLLGRAILELIRQEGAGLADAILVAPGASTSYTVILSGPGLDRTFLHYPGPNDTFCADDVPESALEGAGVFHFGYPPLMKRMYLDAGQDLADLLQRARASGLVTSLDVSQPDPDSEAGRVDWPELFENVLPFVDIFLPGVDELLLMLHPERYEALMDAGDGDLLSQVDGVRLDELSAELLDLGVAVVVLKLGTQGIYLRTTADAARLSGIAKILPLAARIWCDRALLAPALRAEVVGTTGAGDCAIAGFLAGLVRGLPPDDVLTSSAAVGASNVEAADATSGIPSWEAVQARLAAGWAQHDTRIRLRGWGWDVDRRLWIGPGDRGGLIASSK